MNQESLENETRRILLRNEEVVVAAEVGGVEDEVGGVGVAGAELAEAVGEATTKKICVDIAVCVLSNIFQ